MSNNKLSGSIANPEKDVTKKIEGVEPTCQSCREAVVWVRHPCPVINRFSPERYGQPICNCCDMCREICLDRMP